MREWCGDTGCSLGFIRWEEVEYLLGINGILVVLWEMTNSLLQ